MQEYLNAAEDARWGIVSDGVTLRLARDNASLTRPAWVQADLGRIFTEARYADFAALWLLAHESRFGKAGGLPDESPLERWRTAGQEEGTSARERMSGGVKEALGALGQGFLSHPDNQAIGQALRDGTLKREAYFHELLRLVYRVIFLLAVEERGVLHPDGVADPTRALYADGYGMRRLRDRAVRRSAHDRYGDLWESTKIVFRGLADGEPQLGLPALAGLFAPGQCPTLDASRLANADLLLAMFRLAWLCEPTGLSRVNWRDMGPEELGSVYESLLELVPQIVTDGRQFAFASGGETKGHARKTTGSYYTPDSLVQVLLDSALEPVIAETIAAHPEQPAAALLQLSIVDPACGSGHFLLAAARRLAAHVARLTANATPSAAEYRHALRHVVGGCVYGVDLNPMAVELCKVSLWMEAVEPGLPLTFLDSHLRQGNALLGTTPALMEEGIPDGAFEPIEGDDRKVASALKRRNRAERSGQLALGFGSPDEFATERSAVVAAIAALDRASDLDAEALKRKEQQWGALQASEAFRHQKFVADAWCAAFVWPKQEQGARADAAPTNRGWHEWRAGQAPAALARETVDRLAADYAFFHWHLAFPQVVARGGFDVVLGNPPWEHIEMKEEEWFAERRPDIANAENASARKRLIRELSHEDPALYAAFAYASRRTNGETHFLRDSGRFPLCARGRINTYAVFAEHNRAVLDPKGRTGFICPPGLATDDTTKAYFQSLIDESGLVALYEFENEEFLFPGIDHRVRFIAITVTGKAGSREPADLSFAHRRVTSLAEPSRHVRLRPEDFLILNPNTRTCPTFRSQRDAEINLAMYRRSGVLWREGAEKGNPWELRFMQGLFNMASDSGLFRTKAQLEAAGLRLAGNRFEGTEETWLPLIEAKMVHQFDHRFGTYDGQTSAQENQGKLPELDDAAHADPDRVTVPYYWVEKSEVDERLSEFAREWLLGWRDICRSTDSRTVIASLMPRVAVGHTTPLMFSVRSAVEQAALYASLCSFALDYAARQKVGGTHLTYSYLKQLPVLALQQSEVASPWTGGTPIRDWLLPRVLELSYTAWDLEPFARDAGYDGPPFRWDAARRFLLRAELDAAFFHLYGLSRDDTAYVMDTFPIVRKNDEKAHGEYRTKRVILEIYDEMTAAARTGQPYATRLDPPPADPRVAHPDSRANVV